MSFVRQVILKDPENNVRLGIFDNKHKVPVHISIEHHEIHEGGAFEAQVRTYGRIKLKEYKRIIYDLG